MSERPSLRRRDIQIFVPQRWLARLVRGADHCKADVVVIDAARCGGEVAPRMRAAGGPSGSSALGGNAGLVQDECTNDGMIIMILAFFQTDVDLDGVETAADGG